MNREPRPTHDEEIKIENEALRQLPPSDPPQPPVRQIEDLLEYGTLSQCPYTTDNFIRELNFGQQYAQSYRRNLLINVREPGPESQAEGMGSIRQEIIDLLGESLSDSVVEESANQPALSLEAFPTF